VSEKKKVSKDTLPETPISKHEKEAVKSARPPKPPSYMIPAKHPWASMWKVWAVVAAVGAAMAGAGYAADPKRFAFAYLTAFFWGLTIALGGLFFVMLQHITSAGWSVTVRRGAEQVMGTLPVFALLFLGVFLFKDSLYPWMGHGHHHAAVEAKKGYLNLGFWSVRALAYFGIWIFLAFRLGGWSREQDTSGNVELTNKMRTLSAPGILLFALSITFAGIDWAKSLDPAWFSTMFGVYIFAGAVVNIMAFLSLLFTRMREAKLVKNEINSEHFHDLGKLMFAFTVFWAYITFSQYFLIWYANIPEETIFFMERQEHGWGTVSLLLPFAGFFFPFFLVLSRHAKRYPGPRQLGALWILAMHYIDMYWLIMPNVDHHFHFNPLQDLGTWFFVMGVMLAVMFKRMAGAPIIPLRDPRLDRALQFENALGKRNGSRARRPKELPHRGGGPGKHRHPGGDDVRPRQLLQRSPGRRAALEVPRPGEPRSRVAPRDRGEEARRVLASRPGRARAHPHRSGDAGAGPEGARRDPVDQGRSHDRGDPGRARCGRIGFRSTRDERPSCGVGASRRQLGIGRSRWTRAGSEEEGPSLRS
jgi:hypothetical protein